MFADDDVVNCRDPEIGRRWVYRLIVVTVIVVSVVLTIVVSIILAIVVSVVVAGVVRCVRGIVRWLGDCNGCKEIMISIQLVYSNWWFAGIFSYPRCITGHMLKHFDDVKMSRLLHDDEDPTFHPKLLPGFLLFRLCNVVEFW